MSVIWSGITEQGAVVPVQVSETGKVIATAAVTGDYVKISGDTMTGPLVLPGDPNTDLEAATKQYVDASSGGGGGLLSYGAFAGSGSIQGGFNFGFCRRTSKGVYEVGFDTPMFLPNYIVSLTPVSTTCFFRVSALTNLSFEVRCSSPTTLGAADNAMQFAVLATFEALTTFIPDPV